MLAIHEMAQHSADHGTCHGEPATLHGSPGDSIKNLPQLLDRASRSTGGLTYYTSRKGSLEPYYLSYADLQESAAQKARLLHQIDGLSASSIVLIHLDDQRETILWFWAAVLAGLVPALSTPLTHNAAQRKKHLRHLQMLLQKPVILTAGPLVSEFSGINDLRLCTVESLNSTAPSLNGFAAVPPLAGANKKPDDAAVLMLTSGSTGNAKAVPLRHGQILTAIRGKTIHHRIEPGDVFLNWIGLDHVASLCEIHLHASTRPIKLSPLTNAFR
jgi:acyl-CoA synthetase (AMP-forming)/AMP-acid ligase II